MKNTLKIALLCWAIPLILGLFIFCTWWITEEPSWMLAGLGTIALGFLLFWVGLIALLYQFSQSQNPPGSGKIVSIKTILWTGALLLSNFPAAIGLAAGALSWQSRYQISIHNNSKNPLKDIRIFGGGCDVKLDNLPPGNAVSKTFWIVNDGTLLLEASTPIKTIRVQADGYVTNGLGGKTRITFLPDQTVEVENQGQ